jgi:signal transduction histidine kinase/CheY-like chemotaxis protein
VSEALLEVVIHDERDVVLARQRARQIAGLVGFDTQDQTRIATAVSEISRNAYEYARGGVVRFAVEGRTRPQVLVVHIADRGPGIARLADILAGRYDSPTGMGVGIVGAQRLMDRLEIQSTRDGTTVTLKKLLPPCAPLLDAAALARAQAALGVAEGRDALQELKQQNRELVSALQELTRRGEELNALNRELEDTNRGVVALYAELDEKAEHLRRADEIKTRFISNLSHEFRTPVNSIQALARLLLDGSDGTLGPEQQRQVTFIRRAADALDELVNDLLDLVKAEAGKLVVRPAEFDVAALFGALRGMLRPLLAGESVTLVFDEPEGIPALYTDESKVSQILRNLLSNALKFTERGEIRVAARLVDGGAAVAFAVRDTGIGIAPEDQERIFDDFTQVDNPLQRCVKGTGLGLPLCRRLASLLGGRIELESSPGEGSTFTAVIPIAYARRAPRPDWQPDARRVPVLVVEDAAETLLVYEKFLAGTPFQMLSARTVREAREALAAFRPAAIVLDVLLPGEDAWELLAELKRREPTRRIPVLVVSTVDDERKGTALGADAYCVKPIDRQRFVQLLTRLTAPEVVRRILIVDDEEVSRYVLRRHLMTPQHVLLEAATGTDALRQARRERPDVICLDLTMPGVDGLSVLRALKDDPETRGIPVVIVTSRSLGEAERREILSMAAGILPKERVSREAAIAAIDEALSARAA